MDELLQQELAPLVKVRIGKKSYPLAFPMAAVILYKQKTGDNLLKIDTWLTVNNELPIGDPTRYSFKLGPIEEPQKFAFLLHAGMYGGAMLSGKPVGELPSVDSLVIGFRDADRVAGKLLQALGTHIVKGSGDEESEEEPANPPRAEAN